MVEVWLVAISLGLVACLSSMILLTYVMHANVFNPGGWANIWASDGRDYVLFAELRTIMCARGRRQQRGDRFAPRLPPSAAQVPQDLDLGLLDALLRAHAPPLLGARARPRARPRRVLRAHVLDDLRALLVRRGAGEEAGCALTHRCCCYCRRGDFIIIQSDPMASLRRSKGAILGTWMYCLLWWVAQVSSTREREGGRKR